MTQVSWKRQLILATALFVLGMFAYWLEFKHKPESEEKETRTKKLFDLKDASVESVTITSGGKIYSFTCQDFAAKLCKPGDNSKWDVTEPSRLRGDDSNINSLLSALNSTEASDTIDLKEETPEKRAALLKDYGLDPAARNAESARKIDVKTSKGEQIVYFGGTHPIGEGIFSVAEKVASGGKASGAIDDSRVLLTPSYFKNNLEHDLTYWRDKKIMSVHDSEIASFKIDSTKSGKVEGRRTNGQWMLDGGFAGDNETIDTLLNGFSFLTAKDFVSEDKSDEKARDTLKGTKPVLTFVLQKEAPKPAPSPGATAPEAPGPITVTFLAKSDASKAATPKGAKPATPPISKLYVTVSDKDPLYEVDVYAKDRFEKGLKDLRMSKLLSSMERFAAKHVEFGGKAVGAQALILQADNGKWTLIGSKREIDSSKVQSTLDKLSSSKIREFVEGSAIPKGQDDGLRVSIGDEKTPNKRQFLFWKASAKLYARDLGSERKEAYQMDLALADALPFNPGADAFFDKSATPPAAAPAPLPTPVIHGGLPPGLKGMPMGHPPFPGGHPPSQQQH